LILYAIWGALVRVQGNVLPLPRLIFGIAPLHAPRASSSSEMDEKARGSSPSTFSSNGFSEGDEEKGREGFTTTGNSQG
jgi:hypothetical protein